MLIRTFFLLALAAAVCVQARGEDQSATAKKAGLPLQPTSKIEFTTDEGTWISLDVSRDGKTIVFDLLGDLYTLPLTRGEARRLTSGMAFDRQPVFSPDGGSIAFISDRDGADNLWIMKADGSRNRFLADGSGAFPTSR